MDHGGGDYIKKTLAGAMSASPSPSTFAMCSRRPAISRWRERPSGNYVPDIVRFKHWSNSGTVNAVSPWAGL